MQMTHSKGSVLLLVVGLLTIIAMLGGTFLVIARLEAGRAEGSIAHAQISMAASACLNKVVSDLQAGLGFDLVNAANTLPFQGVDGTAGWKAYAPYHEYTDLLFYEDAADSHPSSVYGTGGVKGSVDDGGAANSYLIQLQDVPPYGRLYVAARVSDLSSMLNVNVHGSPSTLSLPACQVPQNLPIHIDIQGLLGGSYTSFHRERCGGIDLPLPDYHAQVATRVTNPQNQQVPYALTDEFFLRSMSSTTTSAVYGRLYNTVPLAPAARKMFCTYSCSRSLLRRPLLNVAEKKLPLLPETLNDANKREWLRQQLSSVAADGTGTSGGGGTGSWEKKFDLGPGPGATGYTKIVSGTDAEGNGWLGAVEYYDTVIGSDLDRDFCYGNGSATFSVTVPEAGEYAVTIRIGDTRPGAPHTMSVSVEGQVMVSTNTSGGQVLSVSKTIQVSDGKATVSFSAGAGSHWVCQSVTVSKAASAPPAVTGKSDMAGHFVANLWAAMNAHDEARAYAVPVDATQTVFGFVCQPVISEVYVKNVPSTNNGAGGDYKWGTAIELYNPTSRSVVLKGVSHSYRLTGLAPPTSTFDFPANMTLAAGARMVLYDYDYGPNVPEANKNPIADFNFNSSAAGWLRVPGLSLQKQNDIRLVRLAEGQTIPVDSVRSSDIGNYSAADPATATTATRVFQRDDATERKRVLVAAYAEVPTATLMASNSGVTAASLPTVKQGFDPDVKHQDPFEQIGELDRIFILGPRVSGGELLDMPHALLAVQQEDGRGKADFCGKVKATTDKYPDVPMACVFGELFECLTPDTTRLADDPRGTRMYGRININTAREEVLQRLPLPTSITLPGGQTVAVNTAAAVTAILNYRRASDRTSWGIAELRGGDPANAANAGRFRRPGFLTPGEIAIPLAKYMDTVLPQTVKDGPYYLEARDSLYAAISNLITVNSDAYALQIAVQLGNDPAAPRIKSYYLAIIDRSNCFEKLHVPAAVLFARMPY